MPDFDGTSRIIEQYVTANFTTLALKFVRFEDTPWKPEELAAPGDQLEEWIEVFVIHTDGQNISVGNISGGGGLKTRYAGLLKADIFTPELEGTRRGLAIANAFGLLFQNKSISGVQFREAGIRASNSLNAGYSRTIVQINFQNDETT